MKRTIPPALLLFFALWLVLMAGGRSRFFQDPGTFWHTIVGEQILFDRGFFDTDEFTFTFYGKEWIPHQWLGEVVMALAHRIGGLDTLLLLTATLLAALYTWLGVRLMRAGFHWSVAAVLVAFGLAASAGHFHVRPHIATIVFFALTMAFLTDYEAKRIGPRRLALLIPLFLAWTNIHGGMLGGLATFALAIIGWGVAWQLGWESPLWRWRDLGWIVLIWLGCAATAFVNPYGIRLPLTWLEIYDSKILPEIIKEHSPLNLSEWTGVMVVLFGAFFVAMLAGVLPKRPRVVWLLPLIWLVLACLRVRHAPLFAVAGLIALADFFPVTRWARLLQQKGSDWFVPPTSPPERLPRRALFEGPAVLVLGALAFQVAELPVPVIGSGWAQLDRTVWPLDLDPELREYDRPGTHIFNDYTYGGYLIYGGKNYRVFVDDRCELFGDLWLAHFVWTEQQGARGDLHAVGTAMVAWQKEYGRFDLALTATDSGFDKYLSSSPYWSVVKRTRTATLYRQE